MNWTEKPEIVNNSYSVSIGIRAQITEQTRDTYRGGGVIPAAIPRLLTSSKYSLAPTNTATARAIVKTHPPANTTPPAETPMPSPKITLFFNWLAFCRCSESVFSSTDIWVPLFTSYNISISVVQLYFIWIALKVIILLKHCKVNIDESSINDFY